MQAFGFFLAAQIKDVTSNFDVIGSFGMEFRGDNEAGVSKDSNRDNLPFKATAGLTFALVKLDARVLMMET